MRPRLYLVDGANYLFRAFYAIRNLSTSKGLPTGALYGFTQMLLKLLREEKPDLIAVCFDTPEPTFRDELYEEYKANRAEAPDDLAAQFPYVRPLVRALGLPVVEKPGFEADDLIGTLARRYTAKGFDVVIVSGDKDLMQLVGERVTILDEMKGVRIGPKEVEAKFGVGPERVVEVLGLSGDSSDNIPGLPGVGPKTATSLIQKYGTVEEVIARARELSGALPSKVREHAELARLSRRLVEIDTAVPLEFAEGDLQPRGLDRERAHTLFSELEFSRLIAEVAPKERLDRSAYLLVQDAESLKEIVAKIRKAQRLSLDLETTSLDPMQAEIVGFALAWAEGEAAYVPVAHAAAAKQLKFAQALSLLSPILADEGIAKIGQNLNYDLTILTRLGIEVRGVAFDTMLASYVLDPAESHGLDAMALRHLDHKMISYEEVAGKGKGERPFAEVGLDAARAYAAEDADAALRLADLFAKRIEEEKLGEFFRAIEMPLLPVLIAMQIAGVKVDAARLAEIGADFSKRLAALEKRIHAGAGEPFNVNSPKQLGQILFEKLRLPGAKRTKTGFSTSQDVLEGLAASHELPRLVLEYRSLAKLVSTYVESLPQLIHPGTGRVHTSFNQAVAATGRLSSSDPNLQNIPVRTEEGRKIREAFVAEEGFLLLSADYSQIELRILAHVSGDATLVEGFREGQDVHAITAAGLFGVPPERVTREQRGAGKTVNFATIYGQTPFGLSKQLGIGVEEAASYIENYFKRYPGVRACREDVLARAKREGRVETLFGRRRFFPDIQSPNQILRQLAERTAFNTLFQGTAADIIKRAMIAIHAGLASVSSRARMILQVHDELIFEAPEGELEPVKDFVRERMEGAAELTVPLVVEMAAARNWAAAHG